MAQTNLGIIYYEGKYVSRVMQEHKIFLALFIMKVNISRKISTERFIILHFLPTKMIKWHKLILEIFIMKVNIFPKHQQSDSLLNTRCKSKCCKCAI